MRRRLAYLLRRARSIEGKRIWSLATAIAPTAHWPAVRVFVDILWCSVRYEVAFQDYQDWDVYELSRRERATLMTHPKSDHIAARYDAPSHRHLFADKIEFNRLFADYLGREWIDLRQSDAAAVSAFMERHPTVILKPVDELGGHGVEKVDASTIGDLHAFVSRALEARQFLLEECLTQHPELARLNPSSVNTLRLITFRKDDRVELLASALKIGNGGAIDNFSDGGMYTMVDDSGRTLSAAFDGAGHSYSVHPRSGVPILGFEVPLFREAVALVAKAARVVLEIPYVGWDVAIRPDGPVLIEGNYNTGVFQAKPDGVGEYRGLLPRYRAVIGEF
ncbi:MAG TPA: sugar-transfer associated ATP-grasp domain-containing protein [Pseudolysinimonas sp.]|nr:sugar-transfer associated ATP-grasp domain-containing protein [Pseudolysinimonas sp.]